MGGHFKPALESWFSWTFWVRYNRNVNIVLLGSGVPLTCSLSVSTTYEAIQIFTCRYS